MACSETEPAPAQDGGAVVDSGVSLDGSPSDTGRPDATAMDGGDSNDGGSSDSGVLDFDQQIAARLAAQTVPVTALAPPPAVADELYALGRALFFDPILSGNMDVACASCHHPSAATSDALSLSIGSGGTGVGAARGGPGHPPFIARHAPELFNRGDPSWSRMFWDGRVQADPTGTVTGPAALPMGVTTVLAAQALFPLLDRAEMRGQRGDQTVRNTPNELAQIADDQVDAIWAAIVSRLLAIPAYTALFSSAYPGVTTADLTIAHVVNAIAAFETRAFAHTDTPWDRYLRGDKTAISVAAKLGAVLFYSEHGCGRCHSGPLLTDQKFHNTGIPQLGPGQLPEAPFDHGRQRVSGDIADHFAFRTPPLRNVAATAPYMHNGVLVDLNAVMRHYADPTLTPGRIDVNALHADLRATVQTSTTHVADLQGSLSAELVLVSGSTTFVGLSNIRQFLEALTDDALTTIGDVRPTAAPSGLDVP